MPNYWVVGAMWGGSIVNDQTDNFIRCSYWILGWQDSEKPRMAKLRNQIQPGDRIAIKQMLGQGSPDIRIKALGVVKGVDPKTKQVDVDWILHGMSRDVPSKGRFSAIHGPFTYQDKWIQSAFCV